MIFPFRMINSTLKACIAVFSKRDQKLIFVVVVIQTFLGALDLFGVALIGIIGALAVTGFQSGTPGDRVSTALDIFGLQNLSLQQQTSILAITAALILVSRTLLSVILTRKILFFIGRRSAVISGNLISRLLQLNSLQINNRSVQETIYSTTTGVVAVTLGVVGTSVSIIADVSLLLVMSLGLFLVDPTIAAGTFFFFSLVGLLLYKLMQKRAVTLGKLDAQLNVSSNEKISEVLSSYREASVRSRKTFYASEISTSRLRLANVLAELTFMPSISKYVIEGAMIIGGVSIAALQFVLQDSKNAVGTLAVFLAAGTRVAPAILRVQQGLISIKSSLGSARPTIKLISELPPLREDQEIAEYQNHFPNLSERVKISQLSFIYPGATKYALMNVNLEIEPGTTCAIVGPSGSGKTTLVDIILGMFKPTAGSITINDEDPTEIIRKYPGSVAYVPQDVSIFQTTIRENIALGYPPSDATDERVLEALQISQLQEFVFNLPAGLDTMVGARGSRLSGGQRQRLGIARALFTRPKLLILDESTSALDAQVELQVSTAIQEIPYDITKIVIAHRLSTVKSADKVVYLHGGEIKAVGSFDEVRRLVPDFDVQAKLMGL